MGKLSAKKEHGYNPDTERLLGLRASSRHFVVTRLLLRHDDGWLEIMFPSTASLGQVDRRIGSRRRPMLVRIADAPFVVLLSDNTARQP